jgi:plastocyanin
MQRRTFLAAVGTGVSASLAGCGSVGGGEPDGDIGMAANAYQPRTFEATVGEPVVWFNNGSRGHTVSAYEGSLPEGADYWASGGFDDETAARDGFWNDGAGNVRPGETWEYTFETPGEHLYFCIPHERAGMRGTILVRE